MAFTMMQAVAFAGEEDFDEPDPGTATAISAGQTKTVTVTEDNETTTFKFVPEKSGMYEFKASSENNLDTEGRVVLPDEKSWYNDDGEEDSHFLIMFEAEAGKTYYLQAKMLETPDETVSFSVTLSKSEINGIEFVPKESYVYYENDFSVGYIDEDEDEIEYFRYDLPSFMPGDTFTVKKDSGDTVYTYTYDEDEGESYFVSKDGDIIYAEDDDDINRHDNQNNEHWGLGDNTFEIEYRGITCEVTVKIVKSPVTAIEFVPKTSYQYVENDDRYGYWEDDEDEEYFEYELPEFKDGDRLTVTAGEVTTDYYYDYDEEEFRSADGKVINEDSVSKTSDQYNEHWTPGGSNYFTITYMGTSAQVSVVIIESQVESISFTPVKGYTLVENDERYGEMYEDDDEDSYFYYYLSDFADFVPGDKVTLTMKDGSSEEYVYTVDDDDDEVFVCGEKTIDPDSFVREHNQSGKHWTVGSDNEFTLSYQGASCKVTVTIIENPYSKIEFKPVKAYKYTINSVDDGDWEYDDNDKKFFYYDLPNFANGDQLILTKKDGTKETYTYQRIDEEDWDEEYGGYFINGTERIRDDLIDKFSNQFSSPWKAGNNQFTVKYLGLKCKVNVSIVKLANTMTVKPKSVKAKYSKKKNTTIKTKSAFAVKNPNGKVTYKLAKKDKKAGSKIKVAKNGKITIRKGLRKGKYKIKVAVKAAGDATHSAKTVTVTVKIRVK